MAENDKSLDRVQSPTVIAQPVSVGPRQAEDKKDEARKERRRRSKRPGIEETLQQEQSLRERQDDEDQFHIDYHA